MRNRAKCKLCNSIIESFLENDFVTCKCGEISINGGAHQFHCEARNWENFLRIDDQGNEIIVKVKECIMEGEKTLSTEDLFQELELMISYHEKIPQVAMMSSVNYYDFYSALIVIQNILKRLQK